MDFSLFKIESGFIENLITTYITIFFGIISLIFSFKIWDKVNKYNLSIKDILDNDYYIDLNYFKYIKKYIFFILAIILIHSGRDILFGEKYSIFIELFILFSIFYLVYETLKNIINYSDLLNRSIETLFVDKYEKFLSEYLYKVLEKDYNNFSKKFVFKDINYINSDHGNLKYINFINILKRVVKENNDSTIFINILEKFRNNLNINENKDKLVYYQFLLILLSYDWIEKDIKYWMLSNIDIPYLEDEIEYERDSLFKILILDESFLLYKFISYNYSCNFNDYRLFKKYFEIHGYKNYQALSYYVNQSIIGYIDYDLKNGNIQHYSFFNVLSFIKDIIIKGKNTDIFISFFQINFIKKYFLEFLENNKKYIINDDSYKEDFFNNFAFPILENICNDERALINFIKFIIIDIDSLEFHKEILSIISKHIEFNDNKEHLAYFLESFGDFSFKKDYYNKEIKIYNDIIKKYYLDFIQDNLKKN